MPVLEASRLRIRPFTMDDLADVHHLLDIELQDADLGTERVEFMEQRRQWLQWSVLNYQQLANLHQPPYGDRAVVLRSSGRLIGACGFVPCLNPYEQLPNFMGTEVAKSPSRASPEFGLFYAISPAFRRQGFATEAARSLVDYAFRHLRLRRVVAETGYDNQGSIGVMRRLGMRIARNPYPEPPWFQVVGILDNHREPRRTSHHD